MSQLVRAENVGMGCFFSKDTRRSGAFVVQPTCLSKGRVLYRYLIANRPHRLMGGRNVQAERRAGEERGNVL